MKKQSGITLIELIIAVAILGIMASIAVPNFGSFVRNSQLKSTYNSFAAIVATARVEAVNKRMPVTICASSNGTSCVGTWSQGYIAWADTNGNSTVDAAEILRHETVPEGVTISSTFNTAITIAARGRLNSPGTFVFCKGDHDESAKALNLWVTGLGRLATDSDGDNIVEDLNNSGVECS